MTEGVPSPRSVQAALVWVERNKPGHAAVRSILAAEWRECCHDSKGNYRPAHTGAKEHIASVFGVSLEELDAAITVARVLAALTGG